MARTIQELKDDASIIKNEPDAGDNTASRVGTMFLDIIEYLGTLNTSSDSEDEGGSGGGGGGGVSLQEPLSSINNMASTPGVGNKVLVCQNGIWAYGDYGGGSTPTSGVTWSALAESTNEPINLSHLTTALNSYLGNYRFWGQQPAYDATSGNMVVSGNMINVGSITMRYNNDNSKSVRIEVDEYGNLKFNGNIYATGGVSALGNSGSGGGGGGGSTVSWTKIVDSGTKIATITIDGTPTDVYAPTSGGAGGATTLGGLNDVSLVGSPSNGQYLKYNGSNWENGTFGPVINGLNAITGSYTGRYILSATNGNWSLTEYSQSSSGINVSIVGSGNAVTNADVSNNVLTLTKGTVLTSLPVASANTLGGIKVGNHLTISDGKLSVNGNNLSVASATNATNAAQADRLSGSTTYSAWGQTYWQEGKPKNINGILRNVSTIQMDFGSGPNYIEMPNNSSLKIAPAAGTTTYDSRTHVEIVLLNQSNQLSFGYGARLNNFQTDIQGGSMITFATSAIEGVGDSRLNVGQFTKAGQFYVIQGTEGIRIGDGVIKWDSTHNALYVERASDAGGGAANFYASGGVSALGFSGGGSPSISSATIGTLNSTRINFAGNAGTWSIKTSFPGHEQLDFSYGGGGSGDRIVTFPNTQADKYLIGSSSSLYVKKVNGVNKLYFYNGSSEIQIA